MTSVNGSTRSGGAFGGLVLGTFLLILGGLLLAGNLGLRVPGGAWSWWPLIVIGIGLVKIVLPGRDGREGGFWVLLAGLYCLISVFGLFGLGWGSAWPLFLIGAGVVMAVQALLGGALGRTEVRRDDA
jgi:hypothetical protein